MPPPHLLHLLLLLLLLLRSPGLRAYEAPEDKEDVFAITACPAFLTFINAAYLEGVTVELPCLCKPIHSVVLCSRSSVVLCSRSKIHSVVWFYKRHQDSSEDTRALSDLQGTTMVDSKQVGSHGDLRSRFSIRLFSLLVFRARLEDSGLYICGSSVGDFFYAYDLDIQEATTLHFSHVFTSYWPWSVCDRCGVRGEKMRVGLCYVHSLYLNVRFRPANHTALSCGSGGVPLRFGLSEGSGTSARIEARSCHVTCPPEVSPSPERLSLLSFLGYSSPSRPVALPVYYHSHPAESALVLSCPGARPQYAVAWDRGSTPLYRYDLLQGADSSDHRLTIDSGHHLVFQPALTSDSDTYYCWLQGRRAAEIRLLVFLRLGRRRALSDPESQSAVRTILLWFGGMTGVFLLVLLGRLGVTVLREKPAYWTNTNTQCLRATPTNHLLVLAGIAPAEARREAATLAFARKAQTSESHLLHKIVMETPQRMRLKSRRPFATRPGTAPRNTNSDLQGLLGQGKMEWKAAETSRLHLYINDPTDVPGQHLPRKQWTTLNRMRTDVGRFGAAMQKWGLVDNAYCEYGDQLQTV
ncbi:Ig-like V-type domain-containing protein FAM187A [Aplochiton taeniatus]